MNKRPDIGKKAEKALESLDGIKRAEPQPFFYTRVIGRLQKGEKTWWETTGSFLARPVTVTVCLCFVLAFNAVILYRQGSDHETSINGPQAQEIVTDNEYILASNSSFDYENLDQQ